MTAASLAGEATICAGIAALSAVIVSAMTRVGVIDVPGARSSHTRPTPKGGGVGIVLAFVAGVGAFGLEPGGLGSVQPYDWAALFALVAVASVAFLDDMFFWPPIVKLGAQLGAAGLVLWFGLVIDAVWLPGIGEVHVGWLGGAVTLVWMVGVTNAVNFIDGLNGLAAGVVAVCSLFLAGIAWGLDERLLYVVMLAALGGVLGFLPFNFPGARIFMGDVGSQFCGLLLGFVAVACGQAQPARLGVLWVPMLLFGVLFDVGFTLVRRIAQGAPVMQAHRGHLYQVAHRSGMPATWVSLVHWSFAAWNGLCCVVLIQFAPLWPACLAAVLMPQFAWLSITVVRARRCGMGSW